MPERSLALACIALLLFLLGACSHGAHVRAGGQVEVGVGTGSGL